MVQKTGKSMVFCLTHLWLNYSCAFTPISLPMSPPIFFIVQIILSNALHLLVFSLYFQPYALLQNETDIGCISKKWFCSGLPPSIYKTCRYRNTQKYIKTVLKIDLFSGTVSPPMTCLGGTSLEGGGPARRYWGWGVVWSSFPTDLNTATKSMVWGTRKVAKLFDGQFPVF